MSVKIPLLNNQGAMLFDENISLQDSYLKWIQVFIHPESDPSNYFDSYGIIGWKDNRITILDQTDYTKTLKEVCVTINNEHVILLRPRFRGQNLSSHT